jgi:deazaflavin-dependent oxidoreductase (nitroreductase family)
MNDTAPHYQAPGWFTRHVFNAAVAASTRLGISVWGSRVLEVPGRKSGVPHRTPVNPLTLDGEHYLVSPRGETQWVRNLHANGDRLVLIHGRRRQTWAAVEVPDADKEQILRGYLRKWKMEVGVFFDGVDASSPQSELARIAPRHPVFRITRTDS